MTEQEPTWSERYWTPEERENLARQLGKLDAQQLREIIECALNCSEPALVAAILFGSINGMFERVSSQKGLKV